jgi:glycosyltransferase involved in cell wall biosynthesis
MPSSSGNRRVIDEKDFSVVVGSSALARTDDWDRPISEWNTDRNARPSPLAILIAVPKIDSGAADEGAVELARILIEAGHRAIVASEGGRLEDELSEIGATFVRLNATSRNPAVIARNAIALVRLLRAHGCQAVHALGRAPGWSALFAARICRVPFLTTWYTGFREQNAAKRFYNSVMARGDRVISVSDQIAEQIVEHHHVPWQRITVIHSSVDTARYHPADVTAERVQAVRQSWGVNPDTRVILISGRMLRRKGHHVVVQAARRLKDMGLKNFLFVFTGEDPGHSRYGGQLWDLVLATNTTDVIRISGPVTDRPASYAAATVVLAAAIQLEGLQRAILEAMAMARPVIVSDLAAGPEAVLSPPAVPEERMTGLRFTAGDDAALATAIIRLLAYPDAVREAIGKRGRDWVLAQFDRKSIAEQTLALYAAVGPQATPLTC